MDRIETLLAIYCFLRPGWGDFFSHLDNVVTWTGVKEKSPKETEQRNL